MYLTASKFTGGGSTSSTTATIDSMFSSTLTQQASPQTIAPPVLSVTHVISTTSPLQRSKQSTKSISSYFTPVREQSNPPSAKKRKLDMSTSTQEYLATPSQITADTASRMQTDFECDPSKDESFNEDMSIEQRLNFEPHDANSSYDGLTPELLTVCEVCGHRVPVWEEQEHSDYHLAMQLQRGGMSGRGKGRGRGTSILDFVVR